MVEGTPRYTLLPAPPHFRCVERANRRAIKGEPAATLKCRIRRAGDGAVRWLEVHGRAQRDAGGRVVRLHGVLRDVTGRKRAEAAWRRFAALAESSGEFIGMCGPRLPPLSVHPARPRVGGLLRP